MSYTTLSPSEIDGTALEKLAEHSRIDTLTKRELIRFAARPGAWEMASRMSQRVTEDGLREALAEFPSAMLETAFGEEVTLFYLLVALLQIPAAEDRHRARGIAPEVSRATWADLAVWCHHLRKRESRLGIRLDTLSWIQQAFRGRLLRVGSLQFEIEDFTGPLWAFRNRRSGELQMLALPGTRLSQSGASLALESEPGSWISGGKLESGFVHGHPIDGKRGIVLREIVSLPLENWAIALRMGHPMLLVHVPADARLCLDAFLRSAGEALELFRKLDPESEPKGAYGDAWLFDPQVRSFFPDPSRLDEFVSVLSLFPGRISEASTLRRIFGSSATRDSVVLGQRARQTLLQRAVADFLSTPENRLCARGGFILKDRLLPLIEEARQKVMI